MLTSAVLAGVAVLTSGCWRVFQTHVHGDAWRAEAEQQDGDEHHAGRVPRRPQNTRGVPHPHPQLNQRGATSQLFRDLLHFLIRACHGPDGARGRINEHGYKLF